MTAAARFEFAPPPSQGRWLGPVIAVLAHALLLAALTWGVQWKTNPTTTMSAEAELWAALPEPIGPKLVEPPPEAPTPAVKAAPLQPAPLQPVPLQPVPAPVKAETFKPPPPAKIETMKPLPAVKAAPAPLKPEIVLAQEKLRLKEEKRQAQEAARLQEQAEKLKADKLNKAKALAEAEKTNALDAKRKVTLKAEQDKLEAQKIERQREANLKRMAGLAGATGGAEAKGNAPQPSAPTAAYGSKVSARIRANIVFTESVASIAGNPTAEIEVKTTPDGTIVGRKLLKSSGLKSWDDAVLKAIEKTESLPRDTDGRVPSTFIFSFKLKESLPN